MAIQSRRYLYVFSRLRNGVVEISTKFLVAVSEERALAFGRGVFKPKADEAWAHKAIEVYRS